MATLVGPAAFSEIAAGLVTALTDRLAGTPAGPPKRASRVPAAIAWDIGLEFECGLLAVTFSRTFLTDDFPVRTARTGQRASGACASAFIQGNLVVQVIRCAPNPEGSYLAPTVTALEASHDTVEADAWHMLVGTACYLAQLRDDDAINDYEIDELERIGPSGGGVGSELNAYVSIDNRAPSPGGD